MHEAAVLVSEALARAFDTSEEVLAGLYESMRYSLLGGGKRIRPFLTLAFCRMHGGSDEAALPFACAIEALHTYSLIHDDMPCLDNDDERRGEPTNHVKFGESVAILAGDGMQAKAFSLAAENEHVRPEQALAACRLLASAAGPDGMVGGQMIDLVGESRKLSYDELLLMNELKTCRFIVASCELGCIAAGVTDEESLSSAREYAKSLGLCFQLTDDILDSETEKEEKTTFLSHMTTEGARVLASELTERAKAAVSGKPGAEILTALADYLLNRTV